MKEKTRIPIDSIMILTQFYNVSMVYITGANNIKTEYQKKGTDTDSS